MKLRQALLKSRSVFLIGWTLWSLVGCQRQQPLSASGPLTITNSIGMEFVLIPAGKFEMGATENSVVGGKNSPQHRVKITKPFYIGKFEVTHEQFRQLTGPYWTVPPMFYPDVAEAHPKEKPDKSQFPADNVSWNAAQGYCRKLSELPEEKAAGRFYRLPSEAEWEYVCRAGTTTSYAFGDDISLEQANFNSLPENGGVKPVGSTATVGSYPPNAFGVHDMHGNVWEWCFGGLEAYATATRTDPPGELAIYEVLRGGAWDFPKPYCRSDFRTAGFGGYVFVGFRIVCEVDKNSVTASQ